MPTFKTKKVIKYPALLESTNPLLLTQKAVDLVIAQGRSALVVAKSIGEADILIEFLNNNSLEIRNDSIIKYTRSHTNEIASLKGELKPGKVIVATSLASRGTDIKTSKMLNDAGGLAVIVTSLEKERGSDTTLWSYR